MKKKGLIQKLPLLGFDYKSYLSKVLSTERENLIGLWLQNEASGNIAYDSSGKGHHGAYTGVTLGQPGVPGMGLTCPLYDGLNDYNDISSVGFNNDNLMLNPGFETAGGGGADIWANWTETASDGAIADELVIVHEGAHAAKLTAGILFNTRMFQIFPIDAGATYRLRFWSQGDGVNAGSYRVFDNTNNAEIIPRTTTGVTAAAYEMVAVEWTAPATCISIRVFFYCPFVNAGIAYFDASEVRSMDGFLGDVGSLVVPIQVANVGVWTDGINRRITVFKADGDNRIYLLKGASLVTFLYLADGTAEIVNKNTTRIDWMYLGITWDRFAGVNGEVKAYFDGEPTGSTQTNLGTWVGDLDPTSVCIGAAGTGPSYVFDGSVGPVPTWNVALDPDQMKHVSTP